MKYTYSNEKISSKIFEFTYMCAMRDAILREAFKGEKTWVENVTGAKVMLRKYIDKVLNNDFDSQDNHDKYLLEIANEICKAINEERPQNAIAIFSFGNAQKLINMTVKYVYASCYQNPNLRVGFRYCHCPLDSIMLNKVWKWCEDHYGGSNRRREILGRSEDFLKPWGNEGTKNEFQPILIEFPKRYSLFQKAVKDLIDQGDIYPIEFDYMEWK